MPDLIPRRRLSDQVAEQIKRYILAHGLKPGDRLPTEHDLAERFGVSRISVREATKALQFLGLLEAAPRRGLTVGRVDMQRVSEYVGFHLSIADIPAEQLIETRIIIETGALPQLARRMQADPGVYERLHALNDRLRSADRLADWIRHDIAFHHALLEESGLIPLVAFGDLLQIFFQRFRESVKRGEWKRGIESHQRMLDFLRQNDLPGACDILRRHIESHKLRMEAAR
jgi:DNA-binding FadR family transcriptional regulator